MPFDFRGPAEHFEDVYDMSVSEAKKQKVNKMTRGIFAKQGTQKC